MASGKLSDVPLRIPVANSVENFVGTLRPIGPWRRDKMATISKAHRGGNAAESIGIIFCEIALNSLRSRFLHGSRMGRALPFLIRFQMATRTAMYADELRRYIGLRGLTRQADADQKNPYHFFHRHIPLTENRWENPLILPHKQNIISYGRRHAKTIAKG